MACSYKRFGLRVNRCGRVAWGCGRYLGAKVASRRGMLSAIHGLDVRQVAETHHRGLGGAVLTDAIGLDTVAFDHAAHARSVERLAGHSRPAAASSSRAQVS
jgi:hypothetical protein